MLENYRTKKRKILVLANPQLATKLAQLPLIDKYLIISGITFVQTQSLLEDDRSEIAAIVITPRNDYFDPDQCKWFFEQLNFDEIALFVVGTQRFVGKNWPALEQLAAGMFSKEVLVETLALRLTKTLTLIENAAQKAEHELDHLTGLYNRQSFHAKVLQLLGEAKSHLYDMVYINIRDFKIFNDLHGVVQCDVLLQCLAIKLKNLIGEIGGVCARFAADNFYALVPREAGNLETLTAMLDSSVKQLSFAQGIRLNYGVYNIAKHENQVQQICDYATAAAKSSYEYFQKPLGVFNEAIKIIKNEEQLMLATFTSSLEAGDFVVDYQPKYSLAANAIIGAEALVRWNHPQLGLIAPKRFVALFENNGFICQLDYYVWNQVGKFLRQQLDQGITPVPISVNMSRFDFNSDDIFDRLEMIVVRYDLPCHLLHLEITESFCESDFDHLVAVVTRLKARGFVIEIDDFGSGYSSLNMIENVPADILKLDLRFLQKTARSNKTVEFVVKLAHSLNMAVVAEGVETSVAVARLKSSGCDYAQGYFFAKPLNIQEFNELVKARPVTNSNQNSSLGNESWYDTLDQGLIEFSGHSHQVIYLNAKARELTCYNTLAKMQDGAVFLPDLIASKSLEDLESAWKRGQLWTGKIVLERAGNDRQEFDGTVWKISRDGRQVIRMVITE